MWSKLEGGGSAAFACLVLYILFQLKPILAALLKVHTETKEVLSALLERERARAERIAANDAARAAAAETWEQDVTNPIAVPLPVKQPRAQTPRGVPIGEYGLKRGGG